MGVGRPRRPRRARPAPALGAVPTAIASPSRSPDDPAERRHVGGSLGLGDPKLPYTTWSVGKAVGFAPSRGIGFPRSPAFAVMVAELPTGKGSPTAEQWLRIVAGVGPRGKHRIADGDPAIRYEGRWASLAGARRAGPARPSLASRLWPWRRGCSTWSTALRRQGIRARCSSTRSPWHTDDVDVARRRYADRTSSRLTARRIRSPRSSRRAPRPQWLTSALRTMRAHQFATLLGCSTARSSGSSR